MSLKPILKLITVITLACLVFLFSVPITLPLSSVVAAFSCAVALGPVAVLVHLRVFVFGHSAVVLAFVISL